MSMPEHPRGTWASLRRLCLNVFLLAGVLVVCAIALEGGVRIANRWEERRQREQIVIPICAIPDSVLEARLKPNFSGRRAIHGEYDVIERTNRMGLREDREYGPKPKGTFRILTIGDSFTYGWGVELNDTYERRLEQLLNERLTDRHYEVINAGVPGYSTAQELQWLKMIGPHLEPNLVLVGLYIGDDIVQNAQRVPITAQKIETKERRFYNPAAYRARFPIPFKSILAERSEAYSFLRERYNRLLRLIHIRQKPVEADTWWLDLYRKDFVLDEEPGYAYTDTLLTQIGGWATEHGAEVLVVLIPDRSQVSPDYWTKTVGDIVAFDPARYDLAKPNRWLITLGEHAGIPILDLLPTFRELSRRMKLYYDQDHHWTREGHRLAAEEIFRMLVEQGLLPHQGRVQTHKP